MKLIFHTFVNVSFPQRLGQNVGDESVLNMLREITRFGHTLLVDRLRLDPGQNGLSASRARIGGSDAAQPLRRSHRMIAQKS